MKSSETSANMHGTSASCAAYPALLHKMQNPSPNLAHSELVALALWSIRRIAGWTSGPEIAAGRAEVAIDMD